MSRPLKRREFVTLLKIFITRWVAKILLLFVFDFKWFILENIWFIFAITTNNTKYVKCILWPLFVLFQCSSRVDLVPKIGVITFRRRQLFSQCCWQLSYFSVSSNKSFSVPKKMMSYSRIMLTLDFGTWKCF